LRICFVSAALPDVRCGIGDYTHRLATALAAAGAEPVVVSAAGPGLRRDLPYEVVPIATRWHFADTARLAGTILRTRPDIVHIQFPGNGYGRGFAVTALPWALLARRPRLPVALTLHEFDRLSRRHRARLTLGAAPCRLIVTPGGELTRAVERWLGWRPGLRIEEIGLASNVIPGAGGGAGAAAGGTGREKVDFHRRPEELVIGYWGFQRPDKGIETLIDAFALVRASQPARLVVAGDPGPDRDYARGLRDSISRAGLADDTLFTGSLAEDRLSATLLGFDVCVLPFRDGLAANRGSYAAAVAHGIPIVTTSVDRRGLEPGTNTVFVPPGDAAAIADAIRAHARGPRLPLDADVEAEWDSIARRHLGSYGELLGR
jgi:glycosyltransferase involved in cell wall biosynthesis